MRNISTLFYLVDDMNLPFHTMLTSIQDDPLKDEIYLKFLNLIEIDPGSDLVAKIINRLEEIR